MTTKEIRDEELEERKQEKTANNCNRYLVGQLKPTDESIIRRLQNGK